jgi:hypothetical protein
MLDRHTADALAQFCIAQHWQFAADEWVSWAEKYGMTIAFVAKYLSMTSWYGHEVELDQIAEVNCPAEPSSPGLHVESQAADFNLPFFSAAVRLGIARRRSERSSQPLASPLGAGNSLPPPVAALGRR